MAMERRRHQPNSNYFLSCQQGKTKTCEIIGKTKTCEIKRSKWTKEWIRKVGDMSVESPASEYPNKHVFDRYFSNFKSTSMWETSFIEMLQLWLSKTSKFTCLFHFPAVKQLIGIVKEEQWLLQITFKGTTSCKLGSWSRPGTRSWRHLIIG